MADAGCAHARLEPRPRNEAGGGATRRQLAGYARITACQQKRQPSRPLLITLTAARGPS
jgi:hypothetical protein